MTLFASATSTLSNLADPVAWSAAALLGAGWFWQILARNAEVRREHYAEAIRSLYRLREMPYRIRRRMSDEADVLGDLASRLHDLQEDVDYWRAWTANEHGVMGRAFHSAASEVRAEVSPCIDTAWQQAHLQHAKDMVLKNSEGGLFDLSVATSAIERFASLTRHRFGHRRLLGLKERRATSSAGTG